MEKNLTLGNHLTWLQTDPQAEHFDAPSMCEPVHNLSIEEIVRDYSRGIVHNFGPVYYDEGDDIEEVPRFEDLTDLESSENPLDDVVPPVTQKEPQASSDSEPDSHPDS